MNSTNVRHMQKLPQNRWGITEIHHTGGPPMTDEELENMIRDPVFAHMMDSIDEKMRQEAAKRVIEFN